MTTCLATPPPPVLVVGMHNSGTSIISRLLHEHGLFIKAGMESHYESLFFCHVNDRLIMGGGPNWTKLPIMPVKEVLSFERSVSPMLREMWLPEYQRYGYDGVSPWGIKDPRLCVLLPLYLRLFPEASIVHVRRNLDDVAASLCSKRKKHVGLVDDFTHWRLLGQAHENRASEYGSKWGRYHVVSYEEFCLDSAAVARRLFLFVGLKFTRRAEMFLKKEIYTSSIGSYAQYQTRRAAA